MWHYSPTPLVANNAPITERNKKGQYWQQRGHSQLVEDSVNCTAPCFLPHHLTNHLPLPADYLLYYKFLRSWCAEHALAAGDVESSVGELPPTTYPWWGADVIIISHLSHLLPPSMQLLSQSWHHHLLHSHGDHWGKKTQCVLTPLVFLLILILPTSQENSQSPVSTSWTMEKHGVYLHHWFLFLFLLFLILPASQENSWSPPANEHWNTDQQQSIKLDNKILVYN